MKDDAFGGACQPLRPSFRQDPLEGVPEGGSEAPRGAGGATPSSTLADATCRLLVPLLLVWSWWQCFGQVVPVPGCCCLEGARGLGLLLRAGARVDRSLCVSSLAARAGRRRLLLGLRPSPQLFRRLRRTIAFEAFKRRPGTRLPYWLFSSNMSAVFVSRSASGAALPSITLIPRAFMRSRSAS